MACCCPTLKRRVVPADSLHGGQSEFRDAGEGDNDTVEVDSELQQVEELQEASSCKIAKVLKMFFHASPDSKMALKLYGSRRKLELARKRQESRRSSNWMIHPCSHFRCCWDVIVVFLLIFTVTVLPVSIAFYGDDQLNPHWLAVNIIVDTLFLSDIIVTFRTGIISTSLPEGVIFSPRVVAKKYLKGWFVVDLMSSFPFDYFTVIITGGKLDTSVLKASRALRVIRLAKLLSLLKLLRISRLLRFLQRWEDLFDLAGGALRISKLIMLMLLLAHWNGCVQFLVPVMQDYPRNSWISINHLQNATVGEQYSWALFKAISHMLCIGFGRWPPQNITETWLTIVSMMVGATFYALFIGNMSTLLLSIDSSGRLYNEKLSQVDEYMRYRKLPQHLRGRVQEFYELRYSRKYFDEDAILMELSLGLREDIISHNCKDLIKSVSFFQNATPEFVLAVLTKLTFQVFLNGEYIIRAGTKGDRMYFIRSGVVDVLTADGKVATSLSDGAYFGEICLLTEDRRVASVVTATTCDVFCLTRKHFLQLLDEYPDMRFILESIAQRRLSGIGKKIQAEEIKQHGKLSTRISPPLIRNVLDDKSDTDADKTARELELDGSYLGNMAGQSNESSSSPTGSNSGPRRISLPHHLPPLSTTHADHLPPLQIELMAQPLHLDTPRSNQRAVALSGSDSDTESSV